MLLAFLNLCRNKKFESFWAQEVFQFDLEMSEIIIAYTILSEKTTGGPSGPLQLFIFFKKKLTQSHRLF